MRTFIAIYKERRLIVTASSSFDAQVAAAKLLNAKKRYDVTVYLADTPINTGSI